MMRRQVVRTHRTPIHIATLVGVATLLALATLILTGDLVSASLPTGPGTNILTSFAASPNGGFWVQVDGGIDNDENGGSRTLAIGGAPQFTSVPYRGSIAAIPGHEGYWIVTDKGAIFPEGSAPALCGGQLSNCSGFPSDPTLDEYITAAAAAPDGHGLWAVGDDGKVWTAGTAKSYGDVQEDFSEDPTGIAPTPTGHGYYIVLSDGGVYSFGDAVFHGSTGGNKPGGNDVTGMSLSYDLHGKVNGYWLVGSDGGVFTFGDAPFLGSSGGNDGGSPVTNIATRAGRPAYAWVHQNGGVSLSETISPENIENEYSQTALGIPTKVAGAELRQYHSDPRNPYQQWDLWPVNDAGNLVQIVNIHSALCLDLTGYVWDAKLIQHPCKGAGSDWFNQLWWVTQVAGGFVQFTPYGDSPNTEYRIGSTTPALQALVKLLVPSSADDDRVNWTVTEAP